LPPQTTTRAGVPFNAGLRLHMLGIDNHVGLGLAITGLVALPAA
jgi:hypothetical protein